MGQYEGYPVGKNSGQLSLTDWLKNSLSHFFSCWVAQLVERAAVNGQVVGSTPIPAVCIESPFKGGCCSCRVEQMGACGVHNPEVAGSNPAPAIGFIPRSRVGQETAGVGVTILNFPRVVMRGLQKPWMVWVKEWSNPESRRIRSYRIKTFFLTLGRYGLDSQVDSPGNSTGSSFTNK